MKPIILLQTHGPDWLNGRILMCRATWMCEWPPDTFIPHKFIFPADYTPQFPDEISVDAPDGLHNTSLKIHAVAKWTLENEYTHAFIIPTDCYVVTPRLLASGFQKHQYVGYHTYDERHIGGGSGYWVDRSALAAMARFGPYPDYEDRWTGAACAAAGIPADHDPRYTSWEQPESLRPGVITIHLSKGTGNYDPKWMLERHREYFKGVASWAKR